MTIPRRGYDEVTFFEIYGSTIYLTHLVDLDGGLIADRLEFDEVSETIPPQLEHGIQYGPWDDEEDEPYLGNVRDTRKYSFGLY